MTVRLFSSATRSATRYLNSPFRQAAGASSKPSLKVSRRGLALSLASRGPRMSDGKPENPDPSQLRRMALSR